MASVHKGHPHFWDYGLGFALLAAIVWLVLSVLWDWSRLIPR